MKGAVERYCAMKQISVARLCSECEHKAELKGAWMEIAKKLPHRSVQSVYRHGLRQLHPFKRGAWTEEECEILVDMVTKMGKKWAAIQARLNRSADACRDKYREMDEAYVRGRWNQNETEQLKRFIREHLQVDPTAEIRELGKMVEKNRLKIPWHIISKRMVKRSRLSCFKKWQKMTGLYSPSDGPGTDLNYQNEDDMDEGDDHDDLGPVGDADEKVVIAVGAVATIAREAPIEEGVTVRIESSPPPTHAAPTAGAAAALAAAAVNNPIGGEGGSSVDYDLYLLSEIASFGVNRASDVNWDAIRVDSAHERWNELFEEWQTSDNMDDSMLALPLSEIAQLIFDQKTSAQRAAETVEAVDLPPPETLNVREV